jgi:hypothetical protein
MTKKLTRICEGGSIRDTANGKLEYFGFMHPLCDYSFAKYMNEHRVMADGSLRESDNWWAGFGKKVLIQSLTRHVEDLKLLHSGYHVYERREGASAERLVYKDKLDKLPDNVKEITIEECLNAIRFNADSYKLEHLREEGIAK